MKNINLLKFILVGSFLSLSIFLCESSFAATCATTGSTINNRIAETTDCYSQPDVQQVTFYKIAFCKSQPTAPTTTAAVDTTSCSTVFQNTSGSTINIQKGATVNLTGTFTRPPNGTYAYVYVEISPTMATQKVAYFVGARNNTDSSSNGTKCWSLSGNTYGYNTSNPVVTTCGADGATTTGLGLTTIKNNTLNGALGYVNTATFSTTYGGNLTAYLVDSSSKLVATTARDSMGTITKIIGVYPETINLTHQELLSFIEMKYANATGTAVSMGGGTVSNFSGGPFDIYFGVKY